MSKGITPSQSTFEESKNPSISEAEKTAAFKKVDEDEVKTSLSDNNAGKIGNWSDIVAKVSEFDPPTGSFLKNCECLYAPKEKKYRLITANKLMATMLSSDKNKKYIFDAMVCCDVNIDSPSQIDIVLKTAKEMASDLDEFN
jgi:hypothetical protein